MNYGETRVVVCDDRFDLGRRAARAVAAMFRELLARQPGVTAVFAAGESQMTFLDALAQEPGIAWDRVVCFNIDDFWDLTMPKEYTCGWQTQRQLYDRVRPARVELVRFNAPDPEAESRRFEELLRKAAPIDIVCQGIGTSGHLALNEPGSADFATPAWVTVATVEAQSKRQLMADPNFKALGRIPEKGITMTIPAIMGARHVFTIVPLRLKRPIMTAVLNTSKPTETIPATILSRFAGVLFLDKDSCPPAFGGNP